MIEVTRALRLGSSTDIEIEVSYSLLMCVAACRTHVTLFVVCQRQEKRREKTRESGSDKEEFRFGCGRAQRCRGKGKAKRFSSGDQDPLKIEGKRRPSVRYGECASKLAASVSASKIFKECLRKWKCRFVGRYLIDCMVGMCF